MNEIRETIQVSKETENMVNSLIEKYIDLIQND